MKDEAPSDYFFKAYKNADGTFKLSLDVIKVLLHLFILPFYVMF